MVSCLSSLPTFPSPSSSQSNLSKTGIWSRHSPTGMLPRLPVTLQTRPNSAVQPRDPTAAALPPPTCPLCPSQTLFPWSSPLLCLANAKFSVRSLLQSSALFESFPCPRLGELSSVEASGVRLLRGRASPQELTAHPSLSPAQVTQHKVHPWGPASNGAGGPRREECSGCHSLSTLTVLSPFVNFHWPPAERSNKA